MEQWKGLSKEFVSTIESKGGEVGKSWVVGCVWQEPQIGGIVEELHKEESVEL